ncbi:hypothetical protein KIPB_010354, partial [Kipferlia bialata]
SYSVDRHTSDDIADCSLSCHYNNDNHTEWVVFWCIIGVVVVVLPILRCVFKKRSKQYQALPMTGDTSSVAYQT